MKIRTAFMINRLKSRNREFQGIYVKRDSVVWGFCEVLSEDVELREDLGRQ